jgi:hypothetical protein
MRMDLIIVGPHTREKTMADKMTFVLTVLGGVCVFLVGQIALKMIIEPCQEMKKLLGGTSHVLLYYRPKLTNVSMNNDIAIELKAKSAQLVSQTDVILWYSFVRFFFWLPSKKNVLKASTYLNQLSYTMLTGSQSEYESKSQVARDNINFIKTIGNALNVKTDYDDSQ